MTVFYITFQTSIPYVLWDAWPEFQNVLQLHLNIYLVYCALSRLTNNKENQNKPPPTPGMNFPFPSE